MSENVAEIGARAFAECQSLKEIIIPKSVEKIDDTAFEKCEGVTVYGVKGTEAERIATLCGFAFVELKPEIEIEIPTAQKMPAAPVLPAVPLG